MSSLRQLLCGNKKSLRQLLYVSLCQLLFTVSLCQLLCGKKRRLARLHRLQCAPELKRGLFEELNVRDEDGLLGGDVTRNDV